MININISGAIGVSILKRNNNKVIVFSDNHASDEYCYDNSLNIHFKISDFLEKKTEKHIVLLEEVPRKYRDSLNQIFFAEHTELLKELSINNKNIISVDIRPLLLKFSWELITNENKDKYNITLEEYIVNLKKFTQYKIEDEELTEYFELIKNKINNFIETNKDNLLSLLVDIVLLEKINLEVINDIVIDIMDFNIIRLILKYTKIDKHIYLHAGLFHTQNINKWLVKMGFEEIYKYGSVIITSKMNSSCIKLHYDYS
jgi:hypothetical protein